MEELGSATYLAADLLVEHGHLDNVEIAVERVDLVEVLALHALAGRALTALSAIVGIQHLVDDDVGRLDAEAGELLDKTVLAVTRNKRENGIRRVRCWLREML